MFVPLHDANPLKRHPVPVVTLGLIGINVAIWLIFQSGFIIDADRAAAVSFGLIPAVVNDYADLPPRYQIIAERATLVTYMLLHGDIWHLAGNMLFLWVFGDNVEDATGHLCFLAFYLVCGVAGGLMQTLVHPASEVPVIGASGAVSGIVAAYLVLHPRVTVWVLVLMRIPLPLPAWLLLGFWVLFQFGQAILGGGDNTAWWAHVGGLIAGAALIPLVKRRDVPLFDRGLPGRWR
jgi:membrane associated rhomboid family serine protease